MLISGMEWALLGRIKSHVHRSRLTNIMNKYDEMKRKTKNAENIE